MSNAWKISLLGWCIVTTMARPVAANTCRLFKISREEAESRPRGKMEEVGGREGGSEGGGEGGRRRGREGGREGGRGRKGGL